MLTSIPVRDSATMIDLAGRRDRKAKEYVAELNRMRDRMAEKVPYSK